MTFSPFAIVRMSQSIFPPALTSPLFKLNSLSVFSFLCLDCQLLVFRIVCIFPTLIAELSQILISPLLSDTNIKKETAG